jgi:hypothetical protein
MVCTNIKAILREAEASLPSSSLRADGSLFKNDLSFRRRFLRLMSSYNEFYLEACFDLQP